MNKMPRTAWLFILNIALMFGFMALFGFRLNISDSYPLGVYKRVLGSYDKSSLVESCLPKDVADFMVDREYIPNVGNCGGYPAVIKTIYGVPGDIVDIDKGVSINGEMIANVHLMEYDNKRRVLPPAASTTVSQNHVWLMSNRNPESFDARYFGETPADLIRSKLRPLWTLE